VQAERVEARGLGAEADSTRQPGYHRWNYYKNSRFSTLEHLDIQSNTTMVKDWIFTGKGQGKDGDKRQAQTRLVRLAACIDDSARRAKPRARQFAEAGGEGVAVFLSVTALLDW